MGLLIDGQWYDKWYDTKTTKGKFERAASQFRNWVTIDGKAGPTGLSGFKAEKDRYHLYVSLACPWAHRTLVYRTLMQLENYISVSCVNPLMLSHGWSFQESSLSTIDHLYGLDYLYELYLKADENYSGRVTVPVLWDKSLQTIVSNESSEIIRMFDGAFSYLTNQLGSDYSPKLLSEIDKWNSLIYHNVNNGVYKAGFATSQDEYEKCYHQLFEALDYIESHLKSSLFLCGDCLTEADWRLFTTLIRFDSVYYGHFKCNRNSIEQFDYLPQYLRHLYQMPDISKTVCIESIKSHYYYSHDMINPTRIIPVGPVIDYNSPHNRMQGPSGFRLD